jgi:hypothetical protein
MNIALIDWRRLTVVAAGLICGGLSALLLA